MSPRQAATNARHAERVRTREARHIREQTLYFKTMSDKTQARVLKAMGRKILPR